MADRVYTEQEIAALLERAAEMQSASTNRPGAARSGLTLAELEGIAEASGVDPAFLRRAADELERSGAGLATAGTASATHVYAERWAPGELTDDVWEDIVVELRHRYDTDLGTSMGMPGMGRSTTEQIGRSKEWRHTSVSGIETRVMLRPREDGVQVHLSKRVGLASPVTESLLYGGTLAGLVAIF